MNEQNSIERNEMFLSGRHLGNFPCLQPTLGHPSTSILYQVIERPFYPWQQGRGGGHCACETCPSLLKQ